MFYNLELPCGWQIRKITPTGTYHYDNQTPTLEEHTPTLEVHTPTLEVKIFLQDFVTVQTVYLTCFILEENGGPLAVLILLTFCKTV